MTNSKKTINILLVSDFFFPNLGGVETHIFELGHALIGLGYNAFVVTSQKKGRSGIRFMGNNGLKVYYLPYPAPCDGVTFPGIICFLPLLRQIILREHIDIVHGHQATSNLALEAVLHARLLGCRTLFTDHSAFSFAEFGGTHVNKLLEMCVSPCHRLICVSHMLRENLVLRAHLDPSRIYVIPNAINADTFIPDISCRPPPPTVRIVVISRMTFRKGVDLLIDVIPEVCNKCPNVEFVIGGDGPERDSIEAMRDRHQLHSKVTLLGSIPHNKVGDVLRTGSIFLNCSLTEGFCIAIVEAAACGLRVVTTDVGGVPEVLPDHLVQLCSPKAEDLIEALLNEVKRTPLLQEEALCNHNTVKNMYSWKDVAIRVGRVYDVIMEEPVYTLLDQMKILWDTGAISGKLWLFLTVFDFLLIKLFNILYPMYV